jgi:hypothetical protein
MSMVSGGSFNMTMQSVQLYQIFNPSIDLPEDYDYQPTSYLAIAVPEKFAVI